MKNLYVCEKCGKTFTDWDAAYQCENAHSDVENLYRWDFAQDDSFRLTEYNESDSVPSSVYLKSRVLDEEGNPISDANGCPIYRVFRFKRLAHNDVCETMEESLRKRWYADNAIDIEN